MDSQVHSHKSNIHKENSKLNHQDFLVKTEKFGDSMTACDKLNSFFMFGQDSQLQQGGVLDQADQALADHPYA